MKFEGMEIMKAAMKIRKKWLVWMVTLIESWVWVWRIICFLRVWWFYLEVSSSCSY